MVSLLSDRTTQESQDLGRLILRIALATIVLFHGVAKVSNGVAWMAGPLSALGLPSLLAYGTYVAEVVAPVLLIVGYKVRLSALLIAFNMFMAIVLVAREQLFRIKEGGGGWGVELEALILLAAVSLIFLGSGRYGIGGFRQS